VQVETETEYDRNTHTHTHTHTSLLECDGQSVIYFRQDSFLSQKLVSDSLFSIEAILFVSPRVYGILSVTLAQSIKTYSHALLGEKSQGDVRTLRACRLDEKRCGLDRMDGSVMFDLYARLRGSRSFWLGLVDKADNGLECARVRKGG
jgi:hypothetical protein